jgi:hypothetical protein
MSFYFIRRSFQISVDFFKNLLMYGKFMLGYLDFVRHFGIFLLKFVFFYDFQNISLDQLYQIASGMTTALLTKNEKLIPSFLEEKL